MIVGLKLWPCLSQTHVPKKAQQHVSHTLAPTGASSPLTLTMYRELNSRVNLISVEFFGVLLNKSWSRAPTKGSTLGWVHLVSPTRPQRVKTTVRMLRLQIFTQMTSQWTCNGVIHPKARNQRASDHLLTELCKFHDILLNAVWNETVCI